MSKAQNDIDTSHKFSVIYLPSYYKEKGVIFNKDYVVGVEMQNFKLRYTPTKDDIIKAEQIFNQKHNEAQKATVDTKVFFCHWVRQYVGFIDTNGDKNILLQLIDNTKARKINRLLGKNWETVFTIMLSDSFYSVSKRVRINIDRSEISDKL